jgi:hypothetical protein
MKRVLIFLLIPFVSLAQLTAKSGTFGLHDYLDLQSGTGGSFQLPFYPCSTSAKNRDFFMNYVDVSTCICACPSGAIGSPRPFYQSKKSLQDIPLDKPLNLQDTAFFTKIDTATEDCYYHTGCFLPFVLNHSQSAVYIITLPLPNTIYACYYALVILKPIVINVNCSDLSAEWTQNRLTGYTATWYVQNNRTLDFSGVPITGLTNGSKGTFAQVRRIVSDQTELYTLLGQRAPFRPEMRKRKGSLISGLYFAKSSKGIRLLVR